jgi:outer membrane protein TolC
MVLVTPCVGFGQPVESLTLEQAERPMQQRNRELQAARRAVEAARANTTIAGARPNPTLSLGVGSINPQVPGLSPGRGAIAFQ